MSDYEIDYSDIAPLDDEFLNSAKRVENPLLREKKSIRVKSQVLDWFRARAKNDNYELNVLSLNTLSFKKLFSQNVDRVFDRLLKLGSTLFYQNLAKECQLYKSPCKPFAITKNYSSAFRH